MGCTASTRLVRFKIALVPSACPCLRMGDSVPAGSDRLARRNSLFASAAPSRSCSSRLGSLPVFLIRVRSYPFVAPMARASRRVPRQFGATNWTRIRKTGMRTPLFVLEPANSRSSDQAAEQDFTGTVRPIRVSLVELALHATGRGAGGSPALPGQATRLPQEAPET